MGNCDIKIIIRTIDEFLAELGTSTIVDARKARDQLIDLRLICMTMEAEAVPVPSDMV